MAKVSNIASTATMSAYSLLLASAYLVVFVAAQNDRRLALLQDFIKNFDGSTCIGSGIIGCCEGWGCTSADGSCFCDRICHEMGDCCEDMLHNIKCSNETQPTVALTATSATCTSKFTDGCCTGDLSECVVLLPDSTRCYCDVGCFRTNSCCSDIHQIHCYPRSCAEAGKTNCKRTATERCDVTTSQGTCYCDSDCEDCCEDAILLQKEENQNVMASKRKMRELVRKMLFTEAQRRNQYDDKIQQAIKMWQRVE